MKGSLPVPKLDPCSKRLMRITPLLCAGVMALAAAPALASGGSGVSASKPTTPTTTTPATGHGGTTAPGGGASGGGASGGGGASSGGHNPVEPTPTPAPPPPPSTTPPVTTPCATIFVYTQPTGYVNGGTAIWHNIDIASCDSLAENVDIEAVDTDPETGQVEYDQYVYTPVNGYGNTGATLDNDVVPYATTYNITYYVKDASTGKVLATDTASATTPPIN
jgi:hypothetical protein